MRAYADWRVIVSNLDPIMWPGVQRKRAAMQDDVMRYVHELRSLRKAAENAPSGTSRSEVLDGLLMLLNRLTEGTFKGSLFMQSRDTLYYLVDEVAETLEATSWGGGVDRAKAEAVQALALWWLDSLGLDESAHEYVSARLGRGGYHSGRRIGRPPIQEPGKELEAARVKVLESIGATPLGDVDHVVYFVGAGASRPSPSNIPTVKGLLPELWIRSNRMETKPLGKLQTWCAANGIENIEEMLTAVTISRLIIEKPTVHGLLNSVLYSESGGLDKVSMRDIDSVLLLETQLNTFFSLLVGTMLQARPNPIHSSIAAHAEESRSVHIVTTNYDSCIDQALDTQGVKYDYVFNAAGDPSSVSVVKMHGSINWFHCETCQRVFVPAVDDLVKALAQDIPYPVTGMCKHCNLPVQQLLIPPMAYKYMTSPPVVQVWDQARRILEQAAVLVIVGYSFAAADDYVVKMLVNAVGRSPEKRVVIVDTDQQAIDKCKSLMRLHVESFDEDKQFFPLCGDGVELVPEVIEHLKAATAAPSKKTKKPANANKKRAASGSAVG